MDETFCMVDDFDNVIEETRKGEWVVGVSEDDFIEMIVADVLGDPETAETITRNAERLREGVATGSRFAEPDL